MARFFKNFIRLHLFEKWGPYVPDIEKTSGKKEMVFQT